MVAAAVHQSQRHFGGLEQRFLPVDVEPALRMYVDCVKDTSSTSNRTCWAWRSSDSFKMYMSCGPPRGTFNAALASSTDLM